MACQSIHVEVTMRWWVPVYLRSLAFACVCMGQLPDPEKVAAFVGRYGLRVKVSTRSPK